MGVREIGNRAKLSPAVLVLGLSLAKMKLNVKKTKSMIFNFTKNLQFTTNLDINNEPIEVVEETKLLGTYITKDLKWDKNTAEIVKSAWQRM